MTLMRMELAAPVSIPCCKIVGFVTKISSPTNWVCSPIALVSGTELYRVDIKIEPLPVKQWTQVKGQCAGRIDSLVELLMGSISKGVMEIVTRKGEGLFPTPREISLDCSCPDWASLCKHVAATLYGVGARLDHEPKLLFRLRGVDPSELVEAAIDQPKRASKARTGRMARGLDSDELSSVFGVDINLDTGTDGVSPAEAAAPTRPARKTRRAAKPRKVTSSRASKKKTGAKTTARKATSGKKAAAGKKAKSKAAKTATKKKSSAKKTSAKKAAGKGTSTKKAATRKTAVEKAVRKKSL